MTNVLLREAEEETCSRQNPYEDEYFQARREFEKKYGEWREKLHTSKEQDDFKQNRGRRVYFPGDVDEYRDLSEKYKEEERKLTQYQVDCKDETLALFSKWF